MNEQNRIAIRGASATVLIFDECEELLEILGESFEAPGVDQQGRRAGQRRYHEQPTSLKRLRAPRSQAQLQVGAG
jgi:hypothetical protein